MRIKRVEVTDGSLELVDSVIARPPHRFRLEHLDLILQPVRLPDFDGQTAITLSASIPGARQDGTLNISGYVAPGSSEYGFHLRLRNVDLMTPAPYLGRGRLPLNAGTLDLDLDAACRQGRLHAPGSLILTSLELGGPGFTRLTATQRLGAQAALRASQGRISTRFSAEGRCTAPRLLPENSPQARLAVGLFTTLGLQLNELARTLGLELAR